MIGATRGEFFIFFGGPCPIFFFQVLRHKYLKTAQFINLDAGPMGGEAGRSVPP